MATLSNNKGLWSIQFPNGKGGRHTIRLGRIGRNAANAVRSHVDHLRAASKSGQAVPGSTAAWVKDAGAKIHAKLVQFGLVLARAEKQKVALGAMVDAYIARRTDLKERSRTNLKQARRTMVEFFDASRDVRTINKGEARDWARHLRTTLAPPTVSAHVKRARQIFRDGIDRGIVDNNPFVGIKLGSEVNASRNQYIPAADVLKAIEACPDAEWRLIFALARFGGLRTPSETHGMKWSDVDFAEGRMVVHSPKTEHHHGRASRIVPIFPEVRPYLEDCFQLATGAGHVISAHRGENLRTHAERIIERAKLVRWPRLFQNLRASCETDLTTRFPLHVACAWIGNSQLIAARHYLQVTDEHFADASGAKSGADSAGLAMTPTIGNTENLGKNRSIGDNQYPRQDSNKSVDPLELIKWGESALQKALHRLNEAAPHIRAHDIARLQDAISSARGHA